MPQRRGGGGKRAAGQSECSFSTAACTQEKGETLILLEGHVKCK